MIDPRLEDNARTRIRYELHPSSVFVGLRCDGYNKFSCKQERGHLDGRKYRRSTAPASKCPATGCGCRDSRSRRAPPLRCVPCRSRPGRDCFSGFCAVVVMSFDGVIALREMLSRNSNYYEWPRSGRRCLCTGCETDSKFAQLLPQILQYRQRFSLNCCSCPHLPYLQILHNSRAEDPSLC